MPAYFVCVVAANLPYVGKICPAHDESFVAVINHCDKVEPNIKLRGSFADVIVYTLVLGDFGGGFKHPHDIASTCNASGLLCVAFYGAFILFHAFDDFADSRHFGNSDDLLGFGGDCDFYEKRSFLIDQKERRMV